MQGTADKTCAAWVGNCCAWKITVIEIGSVGKGIAGNPECSEICERVSSRGKV